MQAYAAKASEVGYTDVLKGIQRRTLVHGDSTLLTEFRLKGGHMLPFHSHPQEQTGYLVSGHIKLTIGGTQYDIQKGDAWIVPGGVEHGAEVIDDAVAIEVFSPVREDYL
jgi:quercetin dioxygenase-like cupin family protein